MHSELTQIGDSPIAMWGYTTSDDPLMPPGTGMDGSDGNQPRGTQVHGNLCHEYGFNQKQSSCVFMAKSMETNITGSKIVIFLDLRAVSLANPKIITISDIMFNAARAHINQNVSAAITYCFCSYCLMPVAADRMGLVAGRTLRAI